MDNRLGAIHAANSNRPVNPSPGSRAAQAAPRRKAGVVSGILFSVGSLSSLLSPSRNQITRADACMSVMLVTFRFIRITG